MPDDDPRRALSALSDPAPQSGADGTFELGASALQAAARLAFRPAISALADSHFAFWAALLASQADLLCIYGKF